MKKINTYLVMALMVVLTMTTFTSCDKDTRLAMDLPLQASRLKL